MVDKSQYEDFAGDAIGLAGVLAADVLDRDPRVERPICELTVGGGYQRVPPRVLRAIAKHDLGVYDVTRRTGGYYRVVVV
jgi:protein involved in temperature-dependent protein secretion